MEAAVEVTSVVAGISAVRVLADSAAALAWVCRTVGSLTSAVRMFVDSAALAWVCRGAVLLTLAARM